MNNSITTGQAAKIFRVAPRTIQKWFDRGRLKGHRLPDSGDRRITQESVDELLAELKDGTETIKSVGEHKSLENRVVELESSLEEMEQKILNLIKSVE